VQASESLTGVYTEAAVEYIHSKKDKPFFAYITYNQPHLGLFASDKFKGQSRRGLLGDVMEEIDYSVGEVLKALEESGQSENTLIIFSSDNGPWVKFLEVEESKYGDTRLQIGYAEPFRDGKGSTWEGGHRVPGIFYWPGRIHPNAMDQRPASTLDIFPTIAKLVGAELPRDRSIDGRDITPYLIGTRMAVRPFEFIYSYDDNKASAIRVGPWKLHTRIGSQTGNNYGFSPSIEKPLLFQIEHDLSERLDVASEHPELVQKMRDLMLKTQAQIDEEGSFWDK
jgi:arylsulfatase